MRLKERIISVLITLAIFVGFILFMREFEYNDENLKTPIYEWQLR